MKEEKVKSNLIRLRQSWFLKCWNLPLVFKSNRSSGLYFISRLWLFCVPYMSFITLSFEYVLCADAFVDPGSSDGLARGSLHGCTRHVGANRAGLLLWTLLTHYEILQLQGVAHFTAVTGNVLATTGMLNQLQESNFHHTPRSLSSNVHYGFFLSSFLLCKSVFSYSDYSLGGAVGKI